MENTEQLNNTMNINCNIYYQNYININNIINTHTSNSNEKFSQAKSFQFDEKLKKKVFTSEKAILSPLNSEIPSKITSLQSQKDLPSIIHETKEIHKLANKEIYEVREEYFQSENLTEIMGALVITMAAIIFIVLFYAIIGSKLLEPTGNYLLDFIREDQYYCVLLPLMLPVTVIALYCNWVSMKFFRHS